MFQSIMYQYIEGNEFVYKIIDSDFDAEIRIKNTEAIFGSPGMAAVIKEYEKRNLNVAANLALFYKAIAKNNKYWNLDISVEYNKKHWPKHTEEFYEKYLVDIKKYMALL